MLEELDAVEEVLHAAEIDRIERKMMQLALRLTGSRHGAVFLWDETRRELRIDFHVVENMEIELGVLMRERRDGQPNGIAWHVVEQNVPYLTNDAESDPYYAEYFLDVQSVAAAPVVYQNRAIGAITVSSLDRGAYDASHLEMLCELALASAKLLRRTQLYRQSERQGDRPVGIKGLSKEWKQVENLIERVAPTDAPVLIRGESGTGKELVAHSIHFNSRRADKPFVPINCAAINEQLLESTLFGHVRGAFTGADYLKVGEFEKADGGTLFLDELGELTPHLQGKVLRALELGEILPLGSNEAAKRVDVRVIAATNRPVKRMIAQKRFREDLYFRIAVVTLNVPPLRSYLQNLEVLCQMFITRSNEMFHREVRGITSEALAILRNYDFPGNMRELRNIIDHAVIVADESHIRPEDLMVALPSAELKDTLAEPKPRPTLMELRKRWVAERERAYLAVVLDENNGDVRRSAEVLGVDRTTLYRLLNKHKIRFRKRTVRA